MLPPLKEDFDPREHPRDRHGRFRALSGKTNELLETVAHISSRERGGASSRFLPGDSAEMRVLKKLRAGQALDEKYDPDIAQKLLRRFEKEYPRSKKRHEELRKAIQSRGGVKESRVEEVDSKLLPPLKNDPNKTNWWEKVGGLPDLVTRIAKHLVSERGKTESTAIATAISQVRKVCATGRTFGGRTAVHADTKAEYCKAAAEIEAKRAAAKAKSAVKEEALTEQDALSLAQYATEKLNALAESMGAEWVLDAIREREFSASKRKSAAKKGAAMPDGSFPIESPQDLKNAMRAIGRAPQGKRAAVKAHIKKRAKAIGVKMSEEEYALAEEISDEVILLNALAEVFTPPEGVSEAFVIPPLGKLRQQVRANRRADNRKSKSSSSSKSTSGQKRAPAGTPQGGQFISTGGSGPIISGIRKRVGLGQNAGAAQTKKRIERFQQKHGLQVDGIIGRQTATALLTNGKKKVSVGKITTGIRSRLKRRFG